ncbi:MAG: rod shape-determining protein MreC [Candidatus Levybacteria bacterium]|nr:rod shape-determining protein MreC [Candidatus Levybacteria bacterium]
MQRRENNIAFFLVFFGLSLALILIGRSGILNGLSSTLNKTMLPARSIVLGIFSFGGLQNKTIESLKQENAALHKLVSDSQSLALENKALRDQFAKSGAEGLSLLPAKVVGAPGFIPGLSSPSYLIIDKGLENGVKAGSSVVIQNFLVGKVVKATNSFSKVELVSAKDSLFSAKVLPVDGAQISGIIKGRGTADTMVFDNVLLTSSIKKDDIVLTYGEKDEEGLGYPPDLIVGKIISIEKKSSDLFQKAQVRSFVDFTNLATVFVIR